MNFREKYGQWALVLGATEGVGKAGAIEFARRGMDVILVGRREEKLAELAAAIKQETQREAMVVKQDLSLPDAPEALIAKCKDLDIGIVNYVACLHTLGAYWKNDYAIYEKMYRVNIRSFSKLLHHYTGLFIQRDRGAFITVGSLSGFYSLPFCAEYGAQKAYMMMLTEGVAYEAAATKVDVMLMTIGSTVTPTWLKDKPSNPEEVAAAMHPEDVMKEGLDQLGRSKSYIVGALNREKFAKNQQKSRDEMIELMGNLFKNRG